jgi:hypothetical protein
MANAPNRMTRRMAITVAAYIARHGEWPVEARLSSTALHWIAKTLDEDHFARLADRLKLRVTKHSDIAVGGSAGHLVYPPAEHPHEDLIDRVERELGFTDVEFDQPPMVLVDLVASLYGQEVFHQLVLQELFGFSDLAQRLGIWHYTQPPAVVYEPRRGLFDLGLAQFAEGADAPVEVYLELKVWSQLEAEQFRRQHEGAGSVPVVYLLVGPTFFRWQHLPAPRFIGLSELAEAVSSIGQGYGGSVGDLARAYGARLTEEAKRWSQPLDPAGPWDALDHFRFYAEIAPNWPVDVQIYPVTNRSGPQYVLNTPTAWRRPDAAGWTDADVYWELIDARLRFKVTTPHVEQRKLLREGWRSALRAAAKRLGEALTEPRSASGRSMTAAELGGDVRADLLRGGAVEPEEARRLYDRASILFAEAVAEIEAGRVREGIS